MNRLQSLSGDLPDGGPPKDISFIRSIPVRRLSPETGRRRESAR
jgi:hypothetical protein